MRITVTDGELRHVKPADISLSGEDGRVGMTAYWDQLRDRNGGALENLRRAHRELKVLIARAVRTSRVERISLEEIELVCPQLLGPSSWGGYFGSPWDSACSPATLLQWFKKRFGSRHRYYVDGQPEFDRFTSVLIDFSRKDVQKHNYSFRA